MITQLEIKLKLNNVEQKLNSSYGPYMQGYMMSLIDTNYAEVLHNKNLNPYSQYFYYDRESDNYIWRISTLDEESYNKIIKVIMDKEFDEIFIEHENITFKVILKEIRVKTSYKAITDKYFITTEPKRKTIIKTLTPTTYKSNNMYQMFPDIRSLYISLYQKWNTYSTTVSLEDYDVLQHLVEYTFIDNYNLKSTTFSIDGVRINAFMGSYRLHRKGPLPLVNISNMLYEYAQYCGLGAKTSMGMGGIEIE